MNLAESKMMEILIRGKEQYGIVGVKAEFEAEGTRTDEMLRLVEIARKANVKIGLKIGGCEAMRDLLESKQIGVDYIIAPMVESPYALSKYIEAKNKVYTKEESKDIRFLFNVETQQTFEQLGPISEIAKHYDGGVDGIVFGRVDFTLSRKMGRDDINHADITKTAAETGAICKKLGLELVVGGGVALEALEALRSIHQTHLTRFETRKVIFSTEKLGDKIMERGLMDAVEFELLWLTNKQDYYTSIQKEDDKRIQMLDKRLKLLREKEQAGAKSEAA
jgi:hypothetical protein